MGRRPDGLAARAGYYSTSPLSAVFELYQNARTRFVQMVAEQATRPQNIETLQNAGEPSQCTRSWSHTSSLIHLPSSSPWPHPSSCTSSSTTPALPGPRSSFCPSCQSWPSRSFTSSAFGEPRKWAKVVPSSSGLPPLCGILWVCCLIGRSEQRQDEMSPSFQV